jgi:exonuclease III
MMTTNIATLNINGITSATRMQMLRNFIHKHGVDILVADHFDTVDH